MASNQGPGGPSGPDDRAVAQLTMIPGEGTWYNESVAIPNQGYAPSKEELAAADRPLFTQQLRDLPVNVVPNWDNVDLVRRALVDLEWGRFLYASQLADAMGRDDRIQGVLDTRINGIKSLPFEFKPAEDGKSRLQRKIAEAATTVWPKMCDQASLGRIFESGLMMGIGVGEKVWERTSDAWIPTVKFWHPQFLYWRWDTRSFWLITQDGQIEVPENGGGRFVVYCPYGYYLGWMKGRIRSLPLPWLIRSFARRDWARQSEVMGQTIKKLTVPYGASKADKDRFASSVRRLGSEAALECPELDNGKKFDIALIEADSNTWEGFEKLLGHAETAISIAILGQNLTTEVKGGSRAAAQVHDAVRLDYAKADVNSLSTCLRKYLFQDWALFNFAGATVDDAPYPWWHVEPPEDVGQKAIAVKNASDSLERLLGAGVPVDIETYCEEFGIPLLPEDQRPIPAGQQTVDAEHTVDDEEEEGDEDDDEPNKQTATATLSKSKRRGRAGVPAAHRAAQAYADQLAQKSIDRASASMHQKLTLVMQAVNASHSPQELRKKLIALSEHLGATKDSDIAELMEKAQIMAELAGRAAVLG